MRHLLVEAVEEEGDVVLEAGDGGGDGGPAGSEPGVGCGGVEAVGVGESGAGHGRRGALDLARARQARGVTGGSQSSLRRRGNGNLMVGSSRDLEGDGVATLPFAPFAGDGFLTNERSQPRVRARLAPRGSSVVSLDRGRLGLGRVVRGPWSLPPIVHSNSRRLSELGPNASLPPSPSSLREPSTGAETAYPPGWKRTRIPPAPVVKTEGLAIAAAAPGHYTLLSTPPPISALPLRLFSREVSLLARGWLEDLSPPIHPSP
jgi:hypothetical protein